MKYRRFGKTEIKMPVISCGGMRYQHQWVDLPADQIPADNQANLEATVLRALELGINHIETARGYGTSEMQLGKFLPRLPRDEIIVQTKVAPFASVDDFYKTFECSMNYLGLDYVDLLALHGVNNDELLDWTLRPGGCLEAARKLQSRGRARFVGFSTHATTDVILKAVRSQGFDYMNVHWYFVNDLNWTAIEEASAQDMGVFIISPNDKGGKLYDPPALMRDLCRPLTPMQFNALYCLARPQVHTLSCGASRPSDFDEHLAVLDRLDDAAAVIAPIEARLRRRMEEVLGGDWCRNWFEGLPEYKNIPGEIHVSEILRLWMHAKSLDLVEWGKMRYNLLGQGDHWFPGNHAGQMVDSEIRKAVSGSPYADRIPTLLREAHEMLYEGPVQRLSQS